MRLGFDDRRGIAPAGHERVEHLPRCTLGHLAPAHQRDQAGQRLRRHLRFRGVGVGADPGDQVVGEPVGQRLGLDAGAGGQPRLVEITELGAEGEFTVTGAASDAELPAQPASLIATDDGAKEYGFEFEGLKAGPNKVRFENTGKELHHAILFPIIKGKTIEDAEKAFASDGPPKGPPPVDFKKSLGTQVIDGGIAQNIELDLEAGSYAVVCFIQDRKGGKPHIAKGMIDELVVK